MGYSFLLDPLQQFLIQAQVQEVLKSVGTSSNLVDCTYTSSDSITKNSTYKTMLYSPVIENDSYKDLVDTGKRTFSIAELNKG